MVGPELLSQHRFFASPHLDEAHARVARIFCEHRLEGDAEAPRGPTVVNHAPLAATSLNWFDYGRAVAIAPVPFERFYLLQIVLGGNARITDGPRSVAVSPGEATLIAPTEQVHMDWSADCTKLIIRIDRAAIERFAEQWIGGLLPRPLIFERHVAWRDSSIAMLRHTVDLIVADIEAGSGVLGHNRAAKRFEEAMFTALLLLQPSSLARELAGDASPAVPRAVKWAEDYMHANATQPITIADLVEASRVSARTLFENFRRFRGVTPMYFLRRHRLTQARAELLRAEEGASVTDIAVRWNFDQLGRFASFYRSVYGESPSQTLRRAR